MLAALSSARVYRGDIGHRFSVFRSTNDTSRPNWPTLAHSLAPRALCRPRGRTRATTHIIDGAEPLLLLKAAGGSGKSRLLLEAARFASQRPGAPQLFFTDPAAPWSATDINLLPRTSPAVIVFDDGHRRPDLDRIITACRQHNEAIRYLVSCRPSAVAIVTPLVSSLLATGDPPELDLPLLSKQDAETLAHHSLGDAFKHYAERLVESPTAIHSSCASGHDALRRIVCCRKCSSGHRRRFVRSFSIDCSTILHLQPRMQPATDGFWK